MNNNHNPQFKIYIYSDVLYKALIPPIKEIHSFPLFFQRLFY